VHSFASLEIFKPKTAATSFGTAPRLPPSTSNALLPTVHTYEGIKSTLRRAGASGFSRYAFDRVSDSSRSGPEVHSYEPMASMLSRKGGTIARDTSQLRRPTIEGSTVHAYESPRSSGMLTNNTCSTFAKHGRVDAHRSACAVHSYMAPLSTLKTSGAVPFGGSTRVPTVDPRRAQVKLGAAAKLRAAVRPASPVEIEDPLKGRHEEGPAVVVA